MRQWRTIRYLTDAYCAWLQVVEAKLASVSEAIALEILVSRVIEQPVSVSSPASAEVGDTPWCDVA